MKYTTQQYEVAKKFREFYYKEINQETISKMGGGSVWGKIRGIGGLCSTKQEKVSNHKKKQQEIVPEN